MKSGVFLSLLFSLTVNASSGGLVKLSQIVEACVSGKENPQIAAVFPERAALDSEFIPMVHTFCENKGQGQVFYVEEDFQKLIEAGASSPVIPRAALFLRVTQMPSANARETSAVWYADKDLNSALAYFGNPAQKSQDLFPVKLDLPVTVLLVAPAQVYFHAAVVSGDGEFDAAVRTIPGNENSLSAMLITKSAVFDTVVHEFQHIVDKSPDSRNGKLTAGLRELEAWQGADFAEVVIKLSENSAYDTQIRFLNSSLAAQKSDWCLYEETQTVCKPAAEYVPARVTELAAKVKRYRFYPSGQKTCEAAELILNAFSEATPEVLQNLSSIFKGIACD